jgi:S-adenosylmethionine hydrolase
MPPRITLLTDFGTRDGYVAAMKGVIANLAPDVLIDDATHEIAPGDIVTGAFSLARYVPLYPSGSIHVAVVDPGVGSARRALAASVDGRTIIAPDNGLITRVLQRAEYARIVEITHEDIVRADTSTTFHGRDIFAPAAARLARGMPLDELGPALESPVLLDFPTADIRGEEIVGEVITIDRFGNLITNIRKGQLVDGAHVSLDGMDIGHIKRTYADAEPGELLALIGSDGLLEIAACEASAVELTHARRGTRVHVRGANPAR